MTTHTILLIQKGNNKNTRSFTDHENVSGAIEEVVRMYENRLRELNPHVKNITYNVQDLHNYIDHITDLCCLVFDPKLVAYIPRDKEWIKTKVFNLLRKVAGASEQ